VDAIPPWIREQASESRGSEPRVVHREAAARRPCVVYPEQNRLVCPQVIPGWCVDPDRTSSSMSRETFAPERTTTTLSDLNLCTIF
jgi:hypothetical protein